MVICQWAKFVLPCCIYQGPDVPGQVKIRCRTVKYSDHWPMRAPGNIARLWFVTQPQAAIAGGHGHSLRTPETNDVLAVVREPSSVSVNITRPDWLNTRTPQTALILCEKYRRHSINVEIMLRYFVKCAKQCHR